MKKFVFIDIDDFGESFGMNSLRYNGNIEEYIKTKNKEIERLTIENRILIEELVKLKYKLKQSENMNL